MSNILAKSPFSTPVFSFSVHLHSRPLLLFHPPHSSPLLFLVPTLYSTLPSLSPFLPLAPALPEEDGGEKQKWRENSLADPLPRPRPPKGGRGRKTKVERKLSCQNKQNKVISKYQYIKISKYKFYVTSLHNL